MATLANPSKIPATLTEPLRVDVDGEPNPTMAVRPMRRRGRWQIEIEPLDPKEANTLAEFFGVDPDGYQATFVGSHRGQEPGYGSSPIAAAKALLEAS